MDTLTSNYKKSWKNPYIEENQTTQWQKKMYKRTNTDLYN